jgi:hypothetical protein
MHISTTMLTVVIVKVEVREDKEEGNELDME